ncbi:MAG TPA: hydrogenase maturation protease [Propionibacteriaceae bacterium]
MSRPEHTGDKPTILVAGVGNIFLSDDGFGPEVVRYLASEGPLPAQARLVDYGIRGMHLAYDLLEGYAALVLIDARSGSGAAGDLVVLEIGPDDVAGGEFDAHGMDPVAVLATLPDIGGQLPPTYLVGCRPAELGEGIGLTPAVQSSVPAAADAVRRLVSQLIDDPHNVGERV